MNYQIGSVVRTKAGHDKGSFFAILRIEGDTALIADGIRRNVSAPKRKKLKHLAFTHTVLPERTISDDSKLSEALKPFEQKVRVFRGGNHIV